MLLWSKTEVSSSNEDLCTARCPLFSTLTRSTCDKCTDTEVFVYICEGNDWPTGVSRHEVDGGKQFFKNPILHRSSWNKYHSETRSLAICVKCFRFVTRRVSTQESFEHFCGTPFSPVSGNAKGGRFKKWFKYRTEEIQNCYLARS